MASEYVNTTSFQSFINKGPTHHQHLLPPIHRGQIIMMSQSHFAHVLRLLGGRVGALAGFFGLRKETLRVPYGKHGSPNRGAVGKDSRS